LKKQKDGTFVTNVLPYGIYLKKRFCDKANEMTAEIRNYDDDQPLSKEERDAKCVFCIDLFSKDNDGED
jgi:hypothetical protein